MRIKSKGAEEFTGIANGRRKGKLKHHFLEKLYRNEEMRKCVLVSRHWQILSMKN